MTKIPVKFDDRFSRHEVFYWAIAAFGAPERWRSNERWSWDTINTFYFRDQEDAIYFALRWR